MRHEDYFEYAWLEAAVPGFVDYLLDEDGRPLAEDNAPQGLKETVVFDYMPCPYGAGRDGGLMNTTALRQVSMCWNGLLEDLIFLRGVFMQRYPVEMNYFLLARFANFLTSLPGFLVRTGALRWNAVPRRLSGLFKSAQGLYLTANDMILHGGPAVAFDTASTDAFLAHTEAHRIFWVGDKVCSGPPALVRRFVDLAINGASSPLGESWLTAHVRDDSSLDYAELKLKAQMAYRVVEAWIEDALDSSLGGAGGARAGELAADNRLSGLNLNEALFRESRLSPVELGPLVKAPLGLERTQALDFCARYVPLQRHYVDYMRTLQRQVDRTVRRTSEESFCFVRYLEMLDFFQRSAQRRTLNDMILTQELTAFFTGR